MSPVKDKLIFIPGIGGFPEFHQDLLSALSVPKDWELTTMPHGDSQDEPFSSYESYVNYWGDVIAEAANCKDCNIHIVSVSFGSAVALGLPSHILKHVKSICLISPPILPGYMRAFLRLLNCIGFIYVRKLFGKALFWWSDRKVMDVERLHKQRAMLYDDLDMVYTRLWKRLMTLSTDLKPEVFLNNSSHVKLCTIYCKDEILFHILPLTVRSLLSGTKNMDFILAAGDHSDSIKESAALSSEINRHLWNTHEKAT